MLDGANPSVRKLLKRIDDDQKMLALYKACIVPLIVGIVTGYSLLETAEYGFITETLIRSAIVGVFISAGLWWAKRTHHPRFADFSA